MAVLNDLAAAQVEASVAKVCHWLGVPRSTTYYAERERSGPAMKCEDEGMLEMLIFEILQAQPCFGIRQIWAYLRYSLDWAVNLKRVARIMRRNRWTVRHRRVGGRQRS